MTQQFDPSAFRAQLDQAQAGLRDIAKPIAEFWKALVDAGMNETAATVVVGQYVAALLQMRPPA